MTRIPPYLQKADTIGVVCPAGYMSLEKAQSCIHTLQEWGYAIKIGKTLGSDSQNYFSGTDQQRLEDFQQMLDDDEVKAILCARGGYGTGRIIDSLDFKKFKKKPKWIIGFSDITLLHAHIFSHYKIAGLHAPMAAAFNSEDQGDVFIQSLKNALEGRKMKYQIAAHELNKKGEIVGELVGGNLAILAHLVGSSSEFKTKGKILFLEDTGEYLYNIDRMLYQLSRTGKFDRLGGMILGSFTENKDTERPFGKSAYEIIHDIVKRYDFPVCFNFPVGHAKENYSLKIGVGHKLKIGKNKVSLEE
jgi:muramoyltetrapeptide carboxypeptidase